jgi:hypothetical protein
MKKETLTMRQFMNDLDDFPIQPFYEHLLRLRGIRIEQDCSLKDVDGAVARPGKVVFDGSLESRLANFTWFAHAFLHELYHLVEFEMGAEVELYFDKNPGWRMERLCLFYDESKTVGYGSGRNTQRFIVPYTYLYRSTVNKSGKKTDPATDVMQSLLFTEVSFYDLSWQGDGDEHRPSHELAEWLTALTLVRHPGILFEIYPYYAAVCERFSPQLSLFSAKPDLIWGI